MFYNVKIVNLSNKKKYSVVVDMKEPVSARFESLQKRSAILRAIEQIEHKLTKSSGDAFSKAASHIYLKSIGYDVFINNLKTNLNIKVKAKKI